jgi:hypothetical protein
MLGSPENNSSATGTQAPKEEMNRTAGGETM